MGRDYRMNWELNKILELSKGKVVLLIDGERKTFVSGREALKQLDEKYKAAAIGAEDGALVITLEEKQSVQRNSNSDFVKEHFAQFGKEPNLFDGA